MNKWNFFTFICMSACVSALVSWGVDIQYSFPVQPVDKIAFSKGGHSYPGIDIYGKRGITFVAPVSGVVEDVQRDDDWNRTMNDPEKKGGRWVSFLGDDGFRYYGSHLESVSDRVWVGQRMKPGDLLGYIGNSGNAKGTPTHLHFGISYASTPYSWKTRRGEVEPYHFLRCLLNKGCDPKAVLTKDDVGTHLVNAAREQIGKTVLYDPSYQSIEYPGGDVPIDRGVCTDVIVRAFRAGLNVDLQRLIHEDMSRDFKKYHNSWGLKSPDKNIDHRRVANLQTYLKKRGYSLVVSKKTDDYKPGDLVSCIVPPNLPHIMIVSDKKDKSGRPLVIHNIGAGTKEEDRLFEFELTGHYRIKQIEQMHPVGSAIPRR